MRLFSEFGQFRVAFFYQTLSKKELIKLHIFYLKEAKFVLLDSRNNENYVIDLSLN